MSRSVWVRMTYYNPDEGEPVAVYDTEAEALADADDEWLVFGPIPLYEATQSGGDQ